MADHKKKATSDQSQTAIAHGARDLPLVKVNDYNLELRSGGGFLGDKANKSAFWDFLNTSRKQLKDAGEDPLGDMPKKVSKKTLEDLLAGGDGEQAGVVMGAIDDFAQEFARVITRMLRHESWRDTECIVIGGGMRGGRLGELVIGRTSVILKTEGVTADLVPIRHDPDEAGLAGASQLMPSWMFKSHDALLAVDIGGTNIRVGIVELKFGRSGKLKDARADEPDVWTHADEAPSRTSAVERMIGMLKEALEVARKRKLKLAPLIGIACPGVINMDGSIESGGQNLPGGNWESDRFNLPQLVRDAIPEIAGEPTQVIMHNDAVVQGLSQAPFMGKVARWGVLTIGTGLGNASFTNHKSKG